MYRQEKMIEEIERAIAEKYPTYLPMIGIGLYCSPLFLALPRLTY